nr:hypothetical protein [Tanacetum cinerariifolium]
MQQLMPNPEDITDPTTTMNMALVQMSKAFKLNYSTPTNNNQRTSSNPHNKQIAQPGMDMGQDRQMQMVGGNEWSRHVTIVHQTNDLHTTDYTQLYDFLKYNQKEVYDLRAERLAKTHDPLALMVNSNNPFNYLVFHQDQPSSTTYMQQPLPNINNYNPQSSFNQNYMQQLMPNPEDITDPTTTMNMALVLMSKAFKLNYSTPTNNNQRTSSNPHNRQIAQPGMDMGQDRQMQMVGGNGGNQFRQYVGRNV